jgi:hypothetical protein
VVARPAAVAQSGVFLLRTAFGGVEDLVMAASFALPKHVRADVFGVDFGPLDDHPDALSGVLLNVAAVQG